MPQTTKRSSSDPTLKARPWRFAWIVGAMALVVVVLSFVASRGPGAPFSLRRNAEGQLVPAASNGQRGGVMPSARLEAASIQATNSTSSTHSTQHSANDGLSCRHIAIINKSDHTLLEQLGRALPDQLAKLSFIDKVDYFPANHVPTVGTRSPDLWISLDLGEFKTFGMLPRFTVDAEIKTTVGADLASGNYGRSDSLSPPLVISNWQGTIHHKSTTTGFSTDSYSMAAKNISAALGDALTKHLQSLYDKFGPAPEFDESFYPDYTPTPALLTFDDWGAKQLASTHGFMCSNDTYWLATTTNSTVEIFKDARQRFEKAGWKTNHFQDQGDQPHLSMADGAQSLDIFAVRREQLTPRVTIHVSHPDDDVEPTAEPRKIVVHYTKRLDREGLRIAVDRQLEQGGPFETLLALSSKLEPAQVARYVELLETHSTNSSHVYRALANHYAAANQVDMARDALRRAHWLAKFDPATDDQLQATKTLAKKLEFDELLREKMSPKLFQELGLAELKVGAPTPPVVVGLDEPAFFYVVDPRGEWYVLNWRIKPTGRSAANQRFEVAQAQTGSNGTSSWGSGHLLPTTDRKQEYQSIPGLGRIAVEVRVLEDDTFQFIGSIEPK